MSVVILIRTAPFGMASAGEGFRAIIGVAGMGMETYGVLVDDGVYVAFKGQKGDILEMHSLDEAYEQLEEFDAELIIHKESMEERGLTEDMLIKGKIVDTEELKKIINSAKFVVSFM